eukprot:COSAG01_NODE_50709_length_361_cov_0.755725_1_plen_78_part_01
MGGPWFVRDIDSWKCAASWLRAQGDGRIHELSAAAAAAGAQELWWGVRGAGNSLGLVLEATFQAHLLPCGGTSDVLAA